MSAKIAIGWRSRDTVVPPLVTTSELADRERVDDLYSN